ncbi:hypothetical protein [Aureicoccus marinus]|uniref:Uncharacterized protein n=1 Tax=Aureicoccus marinus TaxID=754435 RepID=A0A2S7T5F4_9FLAO|nr:hypothetical protein [Aureicoccus marinus]PQJ15159.1 hypothetical protein BST99_04930 [Aureicoccus marinus]
MKNLVRLLMLALLVSACNSTQKEEEKPTIELQMAMDSTVTEKQVNFKAIDSDEALIATALMAAPAESREGCKVIGINMAGEWVTFREGSNEFIVITDDPSKPGFNAACYHQDLEPFMARGRELRAQGKSGGEIFDIREAEVKSGQLEMGNPGSTLHIYYGSKTNYEPETNKVEDAIYRYVVYLPFATSESTGLPEVPISPDHPWIMNPGTHRAHIMISPKPESQDF